MLTQQRITPGKPARQSRREEDREMGAVRMRVGTVA